MFCHVCGTEVDDGVLYCPNCGERLDVAIEVTPTIPKEVKPSVVKNKAPVITKEKAVEIGITMILAALYIGVSLLFVFVVNMEDTIMIRTLFDEDVYGYLTLKEFLDVMLKGNRVFNPTVASTALGVGTYLLMYSVPAFATIAFAGCFIRKKSVVLHIVCAIMTIISAVEMAIVTPIAVELVPELKQAVAIKIGVIVEDIKGFSFTKLIIVAVGAIVLVVASGIVTAVLNKRRASK